MPRLVERNMVDEILTEQGFQQSGCTSDECAVEVGITWCQYMVSGAIGKLGDTYTIDAKIVSIETGATMSSQCNIHWQSGWSSDRNRDLSLDILGLKAPDALLEKKRLGTEAFLAASANKTRMGALIRSTVFPGLGQLYSGEN